MGFLSELLKDDKKTKEDNDMLFESKIDKPEYTDDELDDYGLTDWEKEEVKKGNQNPWDFEEEDLEDDDYYSEDDD